MFNALIIGAGKIASEFDCIGDENILTHAHAYTKHPGFNLSGFYDLDQERSQLAAKKWNCRSFDDISFINNIDIISICTPDNLHVESIKQVVKLNPELIFLEKPITNKLDDIPYIFDISKTIPIAVNYSRRYVIEFQHLAQRISSKEFGNYVCGSGYYGKGFIHNGSHMVDLLRLLVGNIEFVKRISEIKDYYQKDHSKNVDIFFDENARFSMHAIDCNNYTIFELDLFFEKARIRILDSGFKVEIYEIIEDVIFNGYRKLQKIENFSTQLISAMFNAMDNIFNFLNGKEKLLCNVHDGYEAIKYA